MNRTDKIVERVFFVVMVNWQRDTRNIIDFEGKQDIDAGSRTHKGISVFQLQYGLDIFFNLLFPDGEIIFKGNGGMIGESQGIKSLVYSLFDVIFRIGGAVAEAGMCMKVKVQVRSTKYDLRFSLHR